MLTVEQVRKIQDSDVCMVDKRKIYELGKISDYIYSRCLSKGDTLIYSIYQNFLSKSEFINLIKKITESLNNKGFVVKRVKLDKPDIIIFHISWEIDTEEDLSSILP